MKLLPRARRARHKGGYGWWVYFVGGSRHGRPYMYRELWPELNVTTKEGRVEKYVLKDERYVLVVDSGV